MRTKNLFISTCLPASMVCIIAYCLLPTAYSFSQGTWTQKADFGGTARYQSTCFSIGTKGYIGTGQDAGGYTKDFWEWDQTNNVWTQKADFGGGIRYAAVGFSIGAKGYIGVGMDAVNPYFKKDFWEWDQASNLWTEKANFGGTTRVDAVGFSIGTKGYIGTGDSGGGTLDFWEWDQISNMWTRKSDFGGAARYDAVGFSIGAKGYIGIGWGIGPLNDFWEWDQVNDVWTQKADFAGTASCEATGFSIANYGYMGTGTTLAGSGTVSDFWKYDPSANSWMKVANFGAGLREMAVGFSIGCKGYIGTGWINDKNMQNDFWEFCPDTVCCNNLSGTVFSQNILCNSKCTGTATVIPTGGTNSYTYLWNTVPVQTTQIATGLCAETYTVTITNGTGGATIATITITQPPVLTATITATSAACDSSNGSATINVIGGIPGYTYSWNHSGQTINTATGLAAGNYTATVTDANGCTATQTVVVVSSGSVVVTNQSASICYGSTHTLPGGTVISIGGVYIDTLSSGGCDSVITTTLTVNSNPTATAFSNVTMTQGQNVTLMASGGGTYSWSPAASGTNGSSITVAPPVTTIYCVTVTDANGCTDDTCLTVTVEQIDCSNTGELYLPNAFSPNGDGENDKLQIYYGNIKCIKTFKLVIYNRWGEKVFTAYDPSAQWDGSYKEKIEEAAVFVYYLETTLISGKEITSKGNISILR